jgi:hypothetical protein
MAIYCDGVHLISDVSIKDLHAQAALLGLKRHWFHASSRFPHYDLPKKVRHSDQWFLDHPEVKRVTSREIYDILKRADLIKKATREIMQTHAKLFQKLRESGD